LKKPLEKLVVHDTLYTFDCAYELNSNLDDLIVKLTTIRQNNPNHSDFRFVVYENGSYDSVDYHFTIQANRYETDEEYTKRLSAKKDLVEKRKKALAEVRRAKQERDKELYERLKRRFEKP
jgi:hypothetical protein